jgi:hypothetical protein
MFMTNVGKLIDVYNKAKFLDYIFFAYSLTIDMYFKSFNSPLFVKKCNQDHLEIIIQLVAKKKTGNENFPRYLL